MASPYLKDGKWYLRWKDDSGLWRGMVSTARTKAEARRLQAELERRAERVRLGVEAARPLCPVLRRTRGTMTCKAYGWRYACPLPPLMAG